MIWRDGNEPISAHLICDSYTISLLDPSADSLARPIYSLSYMTSNCNTCTLHDNCIFIFLQVHHSIHTAFAHNDQRFSGNRLRPYHLCGRSRSLGSRQFEDEMHLKDKAGTRTTVTRLPLLVELCSVKCLLFFTDATTTIETLEYINSGTRL